MLDFSSQLAAAGNIWSAFPAVFSSFQLKDAADIVIVALVIYFVLIFIKQTRSFFIFNSLIFLVAVDFVSQGFNLTLTRELFQPLLAFFLFIFVIVFQREIRRFFRWFATGQMISLSQAPASEESIGVIVKAVFEMASKKIGALIVFPGEYQLDDMLESGFALDGRISYPLILSIFDATTPGHDGAMLIDNNKILRFGIHLPLAEDFKSTAVGTRHRAAVGATERTDALVVVVSEERGVVSVAQDGSLRTVSSPEDLAAILRSFIKETSPGEVRGFWKYFFINNALTKVGSVVLASFLWFVFVFQIGTVQQTFEVPVEFRFLPKDLSIEYANVNNVEITLSGNNSDLSNLDPKTLKAVVDLSQASQGKFRQSLSANDFSIPSYISVTDFSPKEIRVDIISASEKTNQTQK